MSIPQDPTGGETTKRDTAEVPIWPDPVLPVRQRVVLEHQGSEAADSASLDLNSQAAGSGLSGYLHALRRRWPAATSVGLLCATLAAVATWFGKLPTYTAVSLLQIAATEQQLVFQTAEQASRSTFEIYKGTQQQLLISDVVLLAALRKPEVARLDSVQREADPVRWLAKLLRVDFPGNAEILRVSLTGNNPDEVATLVAAVVEAYMNEVVDVERNRRRDRLNDLDRVYTEKETEMRSKRTDLKLLAEQLGTGDTAALVLKQQIALQQFSELRNEAARRKSELRSAIAELNAKHALVEATGKLEITPQELDAVASEDPMTQTLQEELKKLTLSQAEVESRLTKAKKAQYTEKYARDQHALEDKLAARRRELSSALQFVKRDRAKGEITELQSRIASLTEQEQFAAQDLERQQKQAELFGNSSIDVEMMRAEIQQLEKVLTTVAEERQRLKVELNSSPRITLFQRAKPPNADLASNVQNSVFAGLLGFVVPVCLFVWWDVRARRISSLADVSRGLGLIVVGAVPRIPVRVFRRATGASKRHQQWQTRLDEAVDGIVARMFLRRDSRNAHVVLVSSATRGEGKTTLATLLAKRLAQTGERTLLVDLDLRRPSLHEFFGVPRAPGISEILRNEKDFAQAVQQTDTNNLSLLTAGTWMPNLLGTLSNGIAGSLFTKARAQYEFVVFDGSPILPVVDARLASQHVDAVLLSIRRDVSQAPKVLAACEILEAFGVRSFAAVLSGFTDKAPYDEFGRSPEEGVEEVEVT